MHGHTFMPLPGTVYANKTAGRVPAGLRRAVESLIAEGKAFGDWQKQEKQARSWRA